MSTVRSLRYLKSKQVYEANLEEKQEKKLTLAKYYLELAKKEEVRHLTIPLLIRAADLFHESLRGTQCFFPEAKFDLLETYKHILDNLHWMIELQSDSFIDDIDLMMAEYCSKMANVISQFESEEDVLSITEFVHYMAVSEYYMARQHVRDGELSLAHMHLNLSHEYFDLEQSLLEYGQKIGALHPDSKLPSECADNLDSVNEGHKMLAMLSEQEKTSLSLNFFQTSEPLIERSETPDSVEYDADRRQANTM